MIKIRKDFVSIFGCFLFLLLICPGNCASTENYIFDTKWGSQSFGDPGELLAPGNIIVDSSDNVYVVDKDNARIVKFDNNGNYLLQWGYFGWKDGYLRQCWGIGIDPSGNFFIADAGNHRIQEFDSSGNFINNWGSKGFGDGQFDSGPLNIAIDSKGNIFAVGSLLNESNYVQKFDNTGKFLLKWGNTGSSEGEFHRPFDIVIDSADNIYVTDFGNNRIQKFDNSGNFLLQWGTFGQGDGQFSNPSGISIDKFGYIYIADSKNHRIQRFDGDGNFVAKWGTVGENDGQITSPYSIAIDSKGNVFVTAESYSNSIGHRVQKFDNSGNFLTKWGSDDLIDGEFLYPYGIDTNSSNNIFVLDRGNSRVQIFDEYGNFLEKWGGYNDEYGYFPGSTVDITIDNEDNVYLLDSNGFASVYNNKGRWEGNIGESGSATGIASDTSGNIYILGHHQIKKFDNKNNKISTWGSYGTQYWGRIAVDNSGNIFTSDYETKSIKKFDSNGNLLTTWGPYGSDDAHYLLDIEVDEFGNVYVISFTHIQKFDNDGRFLAQWGSPGREDGQFVNARGITVDKSGNVYIADTDNSRIQKFVSAGESEATTFFSVNQTIGPAPLDVHFIGASTGNPISWIWNFGDGSSAENLSEVSHTYTKSGNFTVTLSNTYLDGESSYSKIIQVLPDPHLNPVNVTEGDSAFTLNIYGNGFTENSIVHWQGENQTTRFISSQQLSIEVPSEYIKEAKLIPITITNSVYGTESKPFFFLIKERIQQERSWKYRSDLNNSGVYDDGGIRPEGYKIWEFRASSGNLPPNPVVVNGVVYIKSQLYFDELYAINATTGIKVWDFPTYGRDSTSPAISNGVVYIDREMEYISALDAATGIKLWDYPIGDNGGSSPAVANGVVYVGGDRFYAIDAVSGKEIWNRTIGDSYSSPAIANNTVYVLCLNNAYKNTLFALDAETGATLWYYNEDYGWGSGDPAISNGVVYIGGNDDICALDAATGERIWSYKTIGYIDASPAVSNGIVYIGVSANYDGENESKIYALNAENGVKIWEFDIIFNSTNQRLTSSPSVANGVVYVVAEDTLYALDATTGVKLWDYPARIQDSTPAIANGVVYVWSYDNLYALGPFPENTSIPTISSLNPPSITMGSDSFTLEVTGTNFVNGTKVLWEDQERTTVFVSSTKLNATIPASDVTNNGTFKVKVINPDGAESGELEFEVGENKVPVPVILIHGWNGSPETWDELKTRLEQENIPFFILDYSDYNKADPRVVANTLNLKIEEYKTVHHYDGKFDIVCHSMGGLVSRWYIEQLDGEKNIRQWIGIAPANHGCALADKPLGPLRLIFLGAAGEQLMTDSITVTTLSQNVTSNPINYHVIVGINRERDPNIYEDEKIRAVAFNGETYTRYCEETSCTDYYGYTYLGDGILSTTQSQLIGSTTDYFDGLDHNKITHAPGVIGLVIHYLKNPDSGPYTTEPSEMKFNIIELIPGDILICRSDYSFIPGFWTHCGIYVGDGKVVEALGKINLINPGKVEERPLSDWLYPQKTYVEVLRLKNDNDNIIGQNAAQFAKEQVNKQYDWIFFSPEIYGPSYYCSELVWASYLDASDGMIDLNSNSFTADKGTISPTDIENSEFLTIIGEHKESLPATIGPEWGTSECPIFMTIVDSDGAILNRTTSEIEGGIFVTEPGGGYEEFFIIQTPNNDDYRILIELQPGAQPNDTYKIEVIGTDINGTVNIDFLVENALISDIPENGYTFSANYTTNAVFKTEMLNIDSVKFLDVSTGRITSRLWSFGDGTSAENVTEVIHTYTSPGHYTVNLTVSGPDGEDSTSQVISLFQGQIPPAAISNLHNSTYLKDSIMWTWTDPSSSDLDHVIVYLNGAFQSNVTKGTQAYSVSGLSPNTAYTIGTRTVGTTGLMNSTWVNQTATTAPDSDPGISPPEAQFTSNTTSGNAPLTVQFNDSSSGTVTSYTWDFGDGANSTEQNPVHTYTNYGTYNVSLTVTNAAGEDTITKNSYIQVIPMVGGDTGYYLIHCNVDGAEVYFDKDFKGVITDGTLLVKIFLTASPYHRYSVSKAGYVTVNEALPSYPAKDQTKDIYVTLVDVTDGSWTRPPYPEVTRIQPGYPDSNWTRPPYPEVTRIQSGYPDSNWTRPPYPEVTRIQPGYPDSNWTRPSYLDWLWNRPSIKNFLKDLFD